MTDWLRDGAARKPRTSPSNDMMPMQLALAGPSIRRKRHESVMRFVMGRGVRNGSAAQGTCESQEGPSHASSTTESNLVAYPVGLRHFFAHVALTTYVKHVTARCPPSGIRSPKPVHCASHRETDALL